MRAAALGLAAAAVFASIAPVRGQPAQGRFVQFPEESLLCTAEVPREGRPKQRVATLDDLCAALAACWRVPASLEGDAGLEITVRLVLGENGLILGTPRHTYAAGVPSAEARATLVRETIDAIPRCTPVARTPDLAERMAPSRGDIALRLIYKRPKT